jgi:phage-related minor tail protein
LGKSLQGTLKAVGQSILVDILKSQISLIAKLLIQLATEKLITQEKIIQASISSGGGGGFLGTLAKIGFNAFAGGGSVPLDAPNLYNPVGEFAEGGSVRGGMPITVGERGREMFIPSSNGTIVPNQDLGGGTNITFNIQANDVRGIKELLIDNRATIINLVNQGANAKGRSNVV